MKHLLLFAGLLSWISVGLAETPGEMESSVAVEEAEAVPTFEVMVVADRVNLRNADNLDSDVVGQVNYGDLLTGLTLEEEWVRVRPPEGLAVWVHGGLLFEDREVRARVLNMRSGPGTQFNVLGQLERMDPVTVVENYDEWRRIVPTDAVQVWIFRELVQVMSAPEPESDAEEEGVADLGPEETIEEEAVEDMVVEAEVDAEEMGVEEIVEDSGETMEPADASEEGLMPLTEVEPVPDVVPAVEVAIDVPTDAAEETERISAPEDVKLVPLEGQGTASVRRGWVKVYLLAGTAPSRFHLVYRERGREESLAYLRGDEEELRALAGRSVLVRGRDFWVAGQRVPLMRVESIEAVEASGQ